MEWQQKTEALAALGEFSIKYREQTRRWGINEPWYVEQSVDIRDTHVLIGAFGNGQTPIEAIENHWQSLVTDLEPHQYLIVRPRDGTPRRAVRWNGFMWADVHEPAKDAA